MLRPLLLCLITLTSSQPLHAQWFGVFDATKFSVCQQLSNNCAYRTEWLGRLEGCVYQEKCRSLQGAASSWGDDCQSILDFLVGCEAHYECSSADLPDWKVVIGDGWRRANESCM